MTDQALYLEKKNYERNKVSLSVVSESMTFAIIAPPQTNVL